MGYVYHNEPDVVLQHPSYFEKWCEIVKVVHDSQYLDEDTYVVRFADGHEIEVYPGELDPIPPLDVSPAPRDDAR